MPLLEKWRNWSVIFLSLRITFLELLKFCLFLIGPIVKHSQNEKMLHQTLFILLRRFVKVQFFMRA